MKQKIVETPVESLGKLPVGASCFVEVEGPRLRLKVWKRGQLVSERLLRATALPVGSYDVVDGVVVHSHDPKALLSEIQRHQDRVRLASPAFVKVVALIAKRLGGKAEPWESEEGVLLGYRIIRKAREVADAAIAKVMREFAGELALVVRAGAGGSVGVFVGTAPMDLLPSICAYWNEDVDKLIRKVTDDCGASLVALDRDLIRLRLGKAPKDPKPYVRMLQRLADETGLEYEDDAEFINSLADRELFLWWD